MSTTHNSRPPQSARDDIEYRPLCVTAVIGLLVGIASALAFLHPVLWLLPAAAVVLNMIALRQIGRHQPELVGRRAAKTGLVLGIVFAIAAPTQSYVLAARSRNEARTLARFWIEAVCAHDLQQAASFMQNITAERLAGHEEPGPENDDLPRAQRRVASPALHAVQSLEQLPAPISIRYLGSDELELSAARERINSVWEISAEQDGTPAKVMIQLSLDHTLKHPRRVREWHVNSAKVIDVVPPGFSP